MTEAVETRILAHVKALEDYEIVSVAAKALCVLVVKLDDMIDSEEMRLLPALRRILFA